MEEKANSLGELHSRWKIMRMEKKHYWNYWLHSRMLTPHEVVSENKAVTSGSRFLELQNHFKELA